MVHFSNLFLQMQNLLLLRRYNSGKNPLYAIENQLYPGNFTINLVK